MLKLRVFRWMGAVVACATTVVTSGCVFVPVPPPLVGAPVVVRPRPVVVVPRAPVRGYYRGYGSRGYGSPGRGYW
jgi:hypothetical protein